MTWLVLATEHDAPARWAADRLHNLGLSPLMFVTDSDFAGAVWRHQVGDDVVQTTISLRDGQSIASDEISGTLNRLTHVSPRMVEAISPDDRTYALQEMSALVLSWLASLPGPMLNPSDPRGLCGAWRSDGEWALLAGEAGLDSLPVNSGTKTSDGQGSWRTWSPYAPVAEDVIVVGGAVFSGSYLSSATESACLRLSEKSATPILGLVFDGECLAGVTPFPDLRSGGDDLVAAIAEALGAT